MRRNGRWMLAACVVLAACEPDTGVEADRAEQLTVPTDSVESTTSTSTSSTTTSVEVTLPTTTVPPTSTTVPSETMPTEPPPPAVTDEVTTTVRAGVEGGWTDGAVPSGALDGCCSSFWTGTPSPPFPEDPAGVLGDGLYSASVAAPWSATAPDRLTVDVRRIERCNVLGADACDSAGPFADADVSTAPQPVRTATVTLDEHVAVVLSGFEMCAASVKTGNGRDMAQLMQSFAAAYDRVIAGPLAAGTAPDEIVAAITTGPVDGFSVSDPACMAGLLEYRAGDAPPLLLQTLTAHRDDGGRPPLTPTDVIRLVSVDQHDGLTTLSFDAGFLS